VLSRAAAKELEQILGPKQDKSAAVEPAPEEKVEVAEAAPAKPKRARKPKKETA
jgi:hypothetical protein